MLGGMELSFRSWTSAASSLSFMSIFLVAISSSYLWLTYVSSDSVKFGTWPQIWLDFWRVYWSWNFIQMVF